MDMLVSKYENRIKNFVFQMAEKPIVVKKVKEKLFTNREALLAETSDKILSKKEQSMLEALAKKQSEENALIQANKRLNGSK